MSQKEIYTTSSQYHAVISSILDKQFPELFLILNQISEFIQQHNESIDTRLLQSGHDKMTWKIDEIYRKVKLVIWPALVMHPEKDNTPQIEWIISSLKDVSLNSQRYRELIIEQSIECGAPICRMKDLILKVQHFESILMYIYKSLEGKGHL